MKNKYLILLLILLGLSLRLIFIFLPGFKFDIDAWFAWAQRLNQMGFSQFYSDQIWTNYTPGFLYVLDILGFIKKLFQLSDSSFYLILKIPSILAEIILAVFIYRLFSKKSPFWARIGLLAIFLNPAFIFNSSIWGQIDGLFSLFLMLSVYFLNTNKLISSSVFLGLSFLIKPQSILIFPVFILYIFKTKSLNGIVKLIVPAILVIFSLSLPYFMNQPISGIPNLVHKMMGDYSYTSLFAYNFWGVIGFWIIDSKIWNNLSYQDWGFILFVTYSMLISFLYFKKKMSIYALSALFALGFFFLPTRVHERYLYPGIVFLIISAVSLKSRVLLVLTIFLSFIHFLNLYYVYVYYNEFYLNMPELLYQPTIYNFLDNHGKLMSFLSTLIFALISITIIRISYAHKKNKL